MVYLIGSEAAKEEQFLEHGDLLLPLLWYFLILRLHAVIEHLPLGHLSCETSTNTLESTEEGTW